MSHTYSDHVAKAIREHKQREADKAIIEGRATQVADHGQSTSLWAVIPVGEAREASPESWFSALAPTTWSIQA